MLGIILVGLYMVIGFLSIISLYHKVMENMEKKNPKCKCTDCKCEKKQLL
jgi:hypothetical protein